MANGDDELAKYAVKPEDELAQYKTTPPSQPENVNYLSKLADIVGYTPPKNSPLAVMMGRQPVSSLAENFKFSAEDVKDFVRNFANPANLAMLGTGSLESPLAKLPVPGIAPREMGGEGLPESAAPKPVEAAWRDATRQNVPYAGEEPAPIKQTLAEKAKAQFEARKAAAEVRRQNTPPLFPGATASDVSTGSAQLPGVANPPGKPTPFGQPQLVSKFQAAEPSRIVSPETPAPPINKTYVSYPADMLVELAKKGDLNAIRELVRNPRGIKLSDIPNVGYLVEPGRPGRVYGGPAGQ